MKLISLILITALFLFSSLQCKKDKLTELEKLPPITQTGAGTFGCLINGKAYTPKGYTGNKPNFYIIADPGYFGNLDIRTYRYENARGEYLSMACFDITTSGIYQFRDQARIYPFYYNDETRCEFVNAQTNHAEGSLKITRYDLQNGIIAGEFECKLFDAATSCDTIRITNGRFDYKL